MCLTYAELRLTNLFSQAQVTVNALVNTGATFMCVPESVAVQLGFDVTQVTQQLVTLVDGHQKKIPQIAPIEIAFGNRTYVTEAIVLGNEPLMGALPLEAMDLVVDTRNQRIAEHPDFPVAYAK